MTIEQTIKKAIEGGYSRFGKNVKLDYEDGWVINWWADEELLEPRQTWIESVFLDPSFWQSLRKAMGWWRNPDTMPKRYEVSECSHDMLGEVETQSVQPYTRPQLKKGDPERNLPEGICEVCGWDIHCGVEEWHYQWHQFIDYLAEGKSAEEFFKEL